MHRICDDFSVVYTSTNCIEDSVDFYFMAGQNSRSADWGTFAQHNEWNYYYHYEYRYAGRKRRQESSVGR